MTLKKLNLSNEKGFTLVELMIVVAIIGILAAVAIPNFIAYRNKAFCSGTESDAASIAAALADYFAIPSHVALPTIAQLNNGNGVQFSNGNTATLTSADINATITITVTDGSGRCPADYTGATADWTDNPGAFYSNVMGQ